MDGLGMDGLDMVVNLTDPFSNRREWLWMYGSGAIVPGACSDGDKVISVAKLR